MQVKNDNWLVALLVGLSFSWMLLGCASMGYRAGKSTAKRYYAEDGKIRMVVTPLKCYGYHFMRGWESEKLKRARKARENK